jgi:hypothetical protein
MGGGLPSFVPKIIKKPIDKGVKGVRKVAAEAFEEVIEKPTKKIAAETFDVVLNTDKEERRAMLGGMPTPEPEVTPEVTPEVVPDDTILADTSRRRTKTKRSGAGGTLMEGYGVAYSTPSAKAATGSSV